MQLFYATVLLSQGAVSLLKAVPLTLGVFLESFHRPSTIYLHVCVHISVANLFCVCTQDPCRSRSVYLVYLCVMDAEPLRTLNTQ